ncbi:MAG: hypothetical protein ACP5G6_00150 [Conexivisphaera sp.]|jgi:hypothetical protein
MSASTDSNGGRSEVDEAFNGVAEEVKKASQAQMDSIHGRLEEIREKYRKALAEIQG